MLAHLVTSCKIGFVDPVFVVRGGPESQLLVSTSISLYLELVVVIGVVDLVDNLHYAWSEGFCACVASWVRAVDES